jgi:hypothetical protein
MTRRARGAFRGVHSFHCGVLSKSMVLSSALYFVCLSHKVFRLG